MPFKSKAQQGFMHAHPEILGSKISEWDKATKGKHLPGHVKDQTEQGGGAHAQRTADYHNAHKEG